MGFYLCSLPRSLQICHILLDFWCCNNIVLVQIPWTYRTYFPVLRTFLSLLVYLYWSLLQEYSLRPWIIVWSLWSLGCSELEGGIYVDLWCRKYLSPSFVWTVNMSLFFHFYTFFTILGLFEKLFDNNVPNNSHVFFILCCPCENIMPVWEICVHVCPGHWSV